MQTLLSIKVLYIIVTADVALKFQMNCQKRYSAGEIKDTYNIMIKIIKSLTLPFPHHFGNKLLCMLELDHEGEWPRSISGYAKAGL